MLDIETKRRIDTARDILVGKVPDPKSQVEQITIALIYKFMDDMDLRAAELGGKRKFFSGDFEEYSWQKLMSPELGGFEVLDLYSKAIQEMNINPNIPQLFRDIFKNAFLPYRDPETLKSFIKIINDFQYDHSERLGDAFEYLLSVLGSQGDAGQFRTPRHIIDFMVEVIDPKKEDKIIDPACGTAGFLISSYKHIVKHNSSNYNPEKDKEAFEVEGVDLAELTANGNVHYNGDKLTPDDRTRLSMNIVGYDISPDMVRLSLVNLYLHGFTDPKIYEYDTLTSEDNWNDYADVILANPPFMSPKGGIKPHKRFSIQSKRSEVLFVDYILEHLTGNGRAAIIVPEGIIFQSGTAYKDLRKMLVENYLNAVVSLPAGVFNPYSGVKTSILLIDKALNKKTDKILFVKIENDGFELGAQRRAKGGSQLPKAVEIIKSFISETNSGNDPEIKLAESFSGLSLWNIATKEKIAENDEWNLSGERYKENTTQFQQVKLVELREIANIEYGYTEKAKDKGDARFIRITDINERGELITENPKFIDLTEYSSKYLLNNNDLLVARTGATFGKTLLYKENYKSIFASYLIRINLDKNKILPSYYWSFAQTDFYWRQANNLVTGGAQPQFNGNALKQIKIPLPPLEIQKEIVEEIEGYQKIIDGARQVVENYKPKIDIDPEWPMVELGDYIEFVSGLTVSIPSCEDEDGTPIIAINNVTQDGELTLEGLRKIKVPMKKTINYCQRGDLLFNWRNGSKHLVGKTALFDLEGEFLFASFLLGIRTNRKFLSNKYLWYLLNIYRVDGKYLQFMRQNVNGLFNREELKILPIALPPIEKQEEIVERIEMEKRLVENNKKLISIFEKKIKDRIAKVWGE